MKVITILSFKKLPLLIYFLYSKTKRNQSLRLFHNKIFNLVSIVLSSYYSRGITPLIFKPPTSISMKIIIEVVIQTPIQVQFDQNNFYVRILFVASPSDLYS